MSPILAILLSTLDLCAEPPATDPQRNLLAEEIAAAAGISPRQSDACTSAVCDYFARL